MQLDTYLQETAAHAQRITWTLDAARERLLSARAADSRLDPFSALEYGGILHALQTLIENAIGKAKQLCRFHALVVPTGAYDAFERLSVLGYISSSQLAEWRGVIGLRNRIVHDYLNIDSGVILAALERRAYEVVAELLMDQQVQS